MLTSINLNNICDIPEHSTQQQAFPRMCTIEQSKQAEQSFQHFAVEGVWKKLKSEAVGMRITTESS